MSRSPAASSPSKASKPGSPATDKGAAISLRLQPPDLVRVDAWVAAQPDPKPSRPEAIRRLIEKGLGEPQSAQAIDSADLNASNDE